MSDERKVVVERTVLAPLRHGKAKTLLEGTRESMASLLKVYSGAEEVSFVIREGAVGVTVEATITNPRSELTNRELKEMLSARVDGALLDV